MKKKTLKLKEKRFKLIRSRVSEPTASYRIDVSSTHTNLALNSIIHGDCLEVLRTSPPNVIDLIVTSPPYSDKRKQSYEGNSSRLTDPMVFAEMMRIQPVFKLSKPFLLNTTDRINKTEWHFID